MEAAGAQIDVASLGLRIASQGSRACQDLLSYYDPLRDLGAGHISNILVRTQDLEKTFELLNAHLRAHSIDVKDVERLTVCLNRCERGLKDLEEESNNDIKKYHIPAGSRKQSLPMSQRLDLAKLSSTVQDVREDLDLTLEILHM